MPDQLDPVVADPTHNLFGGEYLGAALEDARPVAVGVNRPSETVGPSREPGAR